MSQGNNGVPKKFDELNQFMGLLKMRISKQEQLLDKIAAGKWKSTHLSEKSLYALAKFDLKLLEEKRVEAENEMQKLKTSLDDGDLSV